MYENQVRQGNLGKVFTQIYARSKVVDNLQKKNEILLLNRSFMQFIDFQVMNAERKIQVAISGRVSELNPPAHVQYTSS